MKRTKQEILARRLKTTALAAGAALATAGAADAAIIGETINETVGPNDTFLLDLDGDGNDDFGFVGSTSTFATGTTSSSTFTSTSGYASVYGFGNNQVFASGSNEARVFTGSESVSSGLSGGQSFVSLTTSFGGPFQGSTPKYLGLRFNTTDFGVVNGWARVAVPTLGQIEIESYAFESDGGAIHIPNEVPEPSTLLLMASGAAGLLALRRRRKS